MFDDLHELETNDKIDHDQWNMLVRFVKRTFAADHYFEDELGLVIFDQGGAATDPRHFELKNAHTPGSTTTAYWQEWSGSAWTTTADSDHEFDVTDPLEEYRGRGKDDYGSPHDDGSLGIAELNSASGEWEIVRMQKSALMITGLATASFASGDATFTIDGVDVMQPIGGLITDQDPAGNITVYNTHSWDGDNNARVVAVWNEDTDHWEALQVDCPA